MKLLKPVLIIIYLIGVVYLLSEAPQTPTVSPATRSTEEGDTWQNPTQRGYYTNLKREEAISQIQSQYTLSVFGFRLPSFRLNYRPEEAFAMVRDQLKSSYLEEIVYPLHSSLFVNGWEPQNAPMYANTAKEMIPPLIFDSQVYFSKVTLKPNNSSPIARLVVWTLIFPASYLVYLSLSKSLKNAQA